MPDETPSDRLRRERDIIRARGFNQSPSELFWGSGNSANTTSGDSVLTMPLNNGPRPQGGIAARIDGGISQSEGLSRTQQKRRIGLPTDKYPFKTLAYIYVGSVATTYLGGDRTPTPIASYPAYPVGLTNTGGKSEWVASSDENFKVGFVNPSNQSAFASEITRARPPGTEQYKGDNYWIDTIPAFPATPRVLRRISGDYPAFFEPTATQLNLQDGSDVAYNFSVAYDETAVLSGASWAPYSAGPLSIGSENWTVSTTYQGITGARPNLYTWTNLVRSESRSGDRSFPLRVHAYDPTGALIYTGTGRRNRTESISKTHTRAQDFSSANLAENINNSEEQKYSVSIPILGSQSLEWIGFQNSKSLTQNITDTRSVAGGTHATYTLSETQTYSTLTANPMGKMLKGANIAICFVSQSGSTQNAAIAETRNITSTERTTVIRPPMQNPVLVSTTNYLVSAVRSAEGPLGNFYSSSNDAFPGNPGSRIPVENEINFREGDPFNVDLITGAFVPGDLYASFSGKCAFYDSPGAYSDNATSSEVFTEYTYTEAKSIRGNIWDQLISGPVWPSDFNWDYTIAKTTTTTINYPVPIDYKIITPTETLTIAPEQTATARVLESAVTAPTGPGTLSINSSVAIASIQSSKLRKQVNVETQNRHLIPGSTVTNTLHNAYEWTSDDLSVVGKRAEVYRSTDGINWTRWEGVITLCDGDRSPPLPPAFRQNTVVQSESNTFVGPYQQTIAVKRLDIAVDAVKSVKYCPWNFSNYEYGVVINSDFAFEPLLNPSYCNLVAGTGDSLAKMYVVGGQFKYVAGKVNYAAVWEFVRSGGGARAVKREPVSGKTKKGIAGETLQAVLYFPI